MNADEDREVLVCAGAIGALFLDDEPVSRGLRVARALHRVVLEDLRKREVKDPLVDAWRDLLESYIDETQTQICE